MKHIIILIKYIGYYITSKNEHSVHSPFVYNFVTNVIYKKSKVRTSKKIKRLKQQLFKLKDKINIVDFGAGSNINKSKERQVKDIAINSAKNEKFGKLLYRTSQHSKAQNIIELGTSLAISTCYLAKANPLGHIYSFEGCPETIKIAKKNLAYLDINNVSIIEGDFKLTLENKLKKIKTVDFVFIDGNHQEKATIQYFDLILKYSHNDTIFIFDDIYWSKGMENAWNHIKHHEKSTVTIDLFFVGIVFIKKELSKENFKIRF